MENLKDELNDLLTRLVKLNVRVGHYVHECKWVDLFDTTLQDICFDLEKIVADIKDY